MRVKDMPERQRKKVMALLNDGEGTTPTTRGDWRIKRLFYDDTPGNPGWYAEYEEYDGEYWNVGDDSMKAWHPEMPRRRDAEKKAWRIARAYVKESQKTKG